LYNKVYVFICVVLSYDGRMGRMASVGDDTPILGAPIRVRVQLLNRSAYTLLYNCGI
jgi:hypothetical protein